MLAFRLSAKNSEIKKNSDDVHENIWANIKKLYARKNILKKKKIENQKKNKKKKKKKNSKYEILNNLNVNSNYDFWGLL